MTSNTVETIRNRVVDDIRTGVLQPGSSLDEKEMSVRFGVSRTPVREALLHLAAQELIDIEPRSGTFVAKLSIGLLRELLELLAEMEATAAKFAARRVSQTDASHLQAALDAGCACSERGDVENYAHFNNDFHEQIYKTAKNQILAAQIRALRLRCVGYTSRQFPNLNRMQRSVAEHRTILGFIVEGDTVHAYEAMLQHISIGGKDFAEFVSGLEPHVLASA
jgi:DNA-binding GntR family transcriptional regulator